MSSTEGLPTLEDSPEATSDAVAALLAGPLPSSLDLDGQSVEVKGTATGTRAQVTLSWPRGSARFRVGLVTATNERRNAEDKGHRKSLQVWSEDGAREVLWTGLEWVIRDAIRAGETVADLAFTNAFYERGAAEEETGIGNADLGRRARTLCERAGLGPDTRVNIGVYDLASRSWRPDATSALRRLLTIALIKTALRDRGRGVLIAGEAPFQIGPAHLSLAAPIAKAPADRLTGVHMWFGPGNEQVDGMRMALRFIADESPTTPSLEAWIRDEGGLAHTRMDIYTRPLLQLDLARRDENDRWKISEAGAELIESESADVLYRAFVAQYVGFEETLAFFGRHPEGDIANLLADLNRRLNTSWTATAQPSRRAHWLRAMGLLEGERGSWRLSANGRKLYDAFPKALKSDLALEDRFDPSAVGPEPARLSAEDVPLGDLQLDASVIAKSCAALNAGKHLLLIGPPGTGKSAVGRALAQHAADVFGLGAPLLATASADWTAYDTIGGWTQRADGRLAFRPGVVSRALLEKRWLVLDELNRADVDKCLGEMFTVLAGGEAETAFTHEDGSAVRIGAGSSYDPGTWFRVIATLNVRDKATLFRLSYALLRRFAVIEIAAPDDATLRSIAASDARRLGLDPHISELAASLFVRGDGLGEVVPLGAAMLRDVLSYVKQRGASSLAVAEGLDLFVLPQLEGLDAGDAKRVHATLAATFAADPVARDHALQRVVAYFPHVRFA